MFPLELGFLSLSASLFRRLSISSLSPLIVADNSRFSFLKSRTVCRSALFSANLGRFEGMVICLVFSFFVSSSIWFL